jgi:hypothetical protein
MIRWKNTAAFAGLMFALCVTAGATQAATASKIQDAGTHSSATYSDDGCQTKTVESMAEIEACRHPEKWQRMKKSQNLGKMDAYGLAALLAITLLYFGSLGWGPVLKAWLIYGLTGFLAAWFIAPLLGGLISGLGAMVLYFQANSSALE